MSSLLLPECDEKFSVGHGPHRPRSISVVLRRYFPDPVHADHQAVAELQQERSIGVSVTFPNQGPDLATPILLVKRKETLFHKRPVRYGEGRQMEPSNPTFTA